MKKAPRDIAAQLVEKINAQPGTKTFFKNIEIAGPGFINMTLSDHAKAGSREGCFGRRSQIRLSSNRQR